MKKTEMTEKQISLRLPIGVSARINALCEMYPRLTKTQIIGDLLTAALDQQFPEETNND